MTINQRDGETKKKHQAGRLAANPRRANIAEGLAFQMMRSFAAVAPVPREEDFGIDAVATLFHRSGKVLTVSDSFFVQVKTHTAASFEFRGNGISWLRSLQLPYFPLVVNLNKATIDLYTLNCNRQPIHLGMLDELVFVPDEDSNGYDDFPLGDPLLSWSLSDCLHEDFPAWVVSVLQPAIRIEALNQRYGRISRLFQLVGHSYKFADRTTGGVAENPPRIASTWDYVPVDSDLMLTELKHAMGPLAYAISNTPGMEDKAPDLLRIRELMRGLGADPDPSNEWDRIACDMNEYLSARARRSDQTESDESK